MSRVKNRSSLLTKPHPTRERRSRKSLPAAPVRKKGKATQGLPPVLVRNEGNVRSGEERKRQKNRRRYDVAVGIPGAEIRLPSLPSVHLGWRVISGLMAILLAGALYTLWTSPSFHVQKIEINGVQRLSEQEVNLVVGLEDEPIFTVNPESIRAGLEEAFPEMKAITVTVGMPNTVNVAVIEREPLLQWRQEDQEVWVDADGMAFPPRGEPGAMITVDADGSLASLPVGEEHAKVFISPQLVATFRSVASRAPEGAHLVYTQAHGLGWTDERGWQVYLGMDLSDVESKLRVYETLAENLWDQGIVPAFISVEYLHAPYYRLER